MDEVEDRSTVIVVPVLDRPHRVAPLLASFWEATGDHPHDVLFVVTDTDTPERTELERLDAAHLVVDCVSYSDKVNAAYAATTAPWLFLGADDVVPHVGWLAEAHRVQADTGALVVGTNDLGNPRVIAGEHSTHTLVARSYCDRPGGAHGQPGTVLHGGYRHWYCDDELIGLARRRGVYAHAGRAVVEHHHPFFGKAETDATYALGASRKNADRAEFRRRQRKWNL